MASHGTNHSYDVLVVGSGIAGVSAAIEAARAGTRVCLATQGKLFGGSSFFPGTWGLGLIAPTDDADERDLAATINAVGYNMAIPELVDTLVHGIRPALAWLEELGVALEKPTDAASAQEDAFIPCFDHKHRLWRGLTRTNMEQAFGREIERLGIDVRAGWELIELIDDGDRSLAPYDACALTPLVARPWEQNEGVPHSDRRIRGGVFIDSTCQRTVALPSHATILTTGGTSGLFARRLTARDVTSSVQGIALSHGCALINIEFMQMMPGLISPKRNLVFNEKSFRYADTDPTLNRELLIERSTHGPFTARLATREVDLAVAACGERGMKVRYRFPQHDIPEFVRTFSSWLCNKQGIAADEELAIALYAHASNGGILIDSEGCCGPEGLYAAGEATGGMHGADRIGGLSSANGLVFGRRAGKAAAAYALRAREDKTGGALYTVSHPQDASDRPSAKRSQRHYLASANAAAMTDELRGVMQRSAMLPRTAEGLTDALLELEELERRLRVRDNYSGATGLSSETPASIQARAARLDAQLLLGRAMLTAMLARSESRGAHYRADFPKENRDLNQPNIIRLPSPNQGFERMEKRSTQQRDKDY